MTKPRKIWMQYHNYDKLGFPASEILREAPNTPLSECDHWVSTSKPSILQSYNDVVYLILGMTINYYKHYYLWTTTVIDEVIEKKDENGMYNAHGEQSFIYPPALLNDTPGFKAFFRKAGHFAYGFQNITNWEYAVTLENLKLFSNYPDYKTPYKVYTNRFKKRLYKKYLDPNFK